MPHIFARRASAKRASRGKSKVGNDNMASVSSNNATTDNGDAVVSVSGGDSSSRRTSQTVSAPGWGGEAVSLKDFANQRKVPGFARVVKGSYMTIGASRFSLHKQHHDIFIHSIKVGVKVLAHCLRRVESQPHRRGGETLTRLCATDQRLTIPLTYQGWFELLSEDGKSARSISGVSELAKVFPSRCLVRENVKGYFTTGDGKLTFDKTKIVPAGEQLKLCEERAFLSLGEGVRVKLLHCVDTKGDDVYLSFDQKAVFTPIAEEEDFTGVFNIRDIIRRFRLPLTVRLVHGVRPRVSESKFSGLVRLDWVYTEETAFVCPLEKNHVRLLPVPSDVSLQLVTATNQEALENSEMFQSIQAKCARMVTNYNNTLHLVVTLPDSVLKKTQHRRSSSSTRDSNMFSTPLQAGGDGPEDHPGIRRRSKSREDLLMDEIDDIYCYVRDGGPVPPKPKFQYDSDEESYWEEPAYEPLDKFQARLTAMECGHPVSFPDHFWPADSAQIQSVVKYGGDAKGAIPSLAGDASGTGQPEKKATAAARDVVPSTGCVSPLPPPLPPRSSDPVAGKPCPAQTSAEDTSMLVNTSRSSLAESDSHRPVLNRRASAPQFGSVSRQVFISHAEDKDSVSAEDAKPSVLIPDSPKMLIAESTPEIPNTRTLHSDSESSLPVPVTSPETSTAVIKEQQTSSDAKPGWKERLRHQTILPDKDVNSITTSGSGQPKGVPKMAKDIQDSDISSKPKASLPGSSSGERSARKRMQTLYL